MTLPILLPKGFRSGRRVLPATDEGWATYQDGARLFLPAGTNYTENPACATTKWGPDDTGVAYTRETTPPVGLPSGFVACTKMVHSSASYPYAPLASAIAVTAGEVYTLSVFVHCSAIASGEELWISATTNLRQWYDAGIFVKVAATNASFVRVDVSITIGVGETTLTPCFLGGTGTGTFWMVGAQLEKSSVLTPYFDGSYPNCAWTGTANASTSTRTASDLNLTGYVQITSAGVTAAGSKVAYARNPDGTYYGPVVVTDNAKSGDWQTAFAAAGINLNTIWRSLVSGDMLVPLMANGIGWVKR